MRDIRRRTRRKFSPEEKIRIVLEGLRGEQSISEPCRREGIAVNLCYRWSKDFLEAGKKRYVEAGLDGLHDRKPARRAGWKLSSTMRASDVKHTLDQALAATGVDHVRVRHRPRLLSNNGPAHVSGELREYLGDRGMAHTRGGPYHPQTQGEIERWHRKMKNVVKLQHYHLPWEL